MEQSHPEREDAYRRCADVASVRPRPRPQQAAGGHPPCAEGCEGGHVSGDFDRTRGRGARGRGGSGRAYGAAVHAAGEGRDCLRPVTRVHDGTLHMVRPECGRLARDVAVPPVARTGAGGLPDALRGRHPRPGVHLAFRHRLRRREVPRAPGGRARGRLQGGSAPWLVRAYRQRHERRAARGDEGAARPGDGDGARIRLRPGLLLRVRRGLRRETALAADGLEGGEGNGREDHRQRRKRTFRERRRPPRHLRLPRCAGERSPGRLAFSRARPLEIRHAADGAGGSAPLPAQLRPIPLASRLRWREHLLRDVWRRGVERHCLATAQPAHGEARRGVPQRDYALSDAGWRS